jgi:hypothetical protein
MLLQEAHSREIHVEPRSLGIVKRGVCTFVQKAHALQNAGANLAIVVNNGTTPAACAQSCVVALFYHLPCICSV